jgi:hypothetical protein
MDDEPEVLQLRFGASPLLLDWSAPTNLNVLSKFENWLTDKSLTSMKNWQKDPLKRRSVVCALYPIMISGLYHNLIEHIWQDHRPKSNNSRLMPPSTICRVKLLVKEREELMDEKLEVLQLRPGASPSLVDETTVCGASVMDISTHSKVVTESLHTKNEQEARTNNSKTEPQNHRF